MTEIRQQPDRIAGRPVLVSLLVALVAAVGSGIVVLLILLAFRGFPSERRARTWDAPHREPPEEVSEVESARFGLPTAAERQAADARHRLDSYGWVDREAGLIHVPIDVAIELYLASPHGTKDGGP